MFNKFAVAFCILLALSGCGSTKKAVNSYTGEVAATPDLEKNIGDRVYFDYDSSHLSNEAKAQLDRQAEWLRSHHNKVVIEGHCDERGTREYNLALGERRANSTKTYLVSRGIGSGRLETISYGKERLAAIGDDENVHRLNRRTVTVMK